MSLTKCSADVNVISGLQDAPSLTASELKGKFDAAGRQIVEYLNNTLTEQVDEQLDDMQEEIERIPVVVNSLDSNDTSAALSAAQGKELAARAEQARGLAEQGKTLAEQSKSLAEQSKSLAEQKQDRISMGTSAPSGGYDGQIYIWY